MSKVWQIAVRPSSAGHRTWPVLLLGVACAASPARRGDTVLYASGADLQSINPLVTVHPLAKQVQNHVLFVTLAGYDSTLAPRPRLASWSWNAARTELTLVLRRDVWWHDGRLTNAYDVAMTLGFARDPATAYPRHGDFASFRDVTVLDSSSLRIGFAGPQPVFPDVLTDLAILPAHLLADATPASLRTHAFNRTPLGNGPFKFVEYRPNQRWVFERAAGFPEALGVPAIGRFVVVVVDESATKLAALTSGELDFAGINPAHAGFVTADPRLEVVDYPLQFAIGLVWNLRRPPFDNREMRRALTLAIDRQTLIDAYIYGFGSIADGAVSPGHPWFLRGSSVPFDPARAARGLDSLGWPRGPDGVRERDGEPLAFEILAVSSGDNALEQLLQAQLAAAGVAVRLRLLELSAFLDVVQGPERTFDALVTGVPGTLSLGHVTAMFGGSGPLSYPGYSSTALNVALEETRTAGTPEHLARAWARVQETLSDDLPTTWLYHSRGVQGKNRRILAPAPDLRGELARINEWSILSRNP